MVSYPSSHVSEQEATVNIVREVREATIFALGRAIRQDIDIIASTGANIAVHLPFDGRYDEALQSCRYANDRYPEKKLAVALVDVGSYSLDSLVGIAKEFERAGAEALELPDTTGSLNPKRYYEIIRRVKDQVSCNITAHCHNDRGLAVANSLAAFKAGADVIDCTVLGLGERKGISDLAIVCDAIENYGMSCGVEKDKLKEVYLSLRSILRPCDVRISVSFLSPSNR